MSLSQDERELDDAFKSKAKEIKAAVAEVMRAERGIAGHQAGIASLTPTLIVAQYCLGSLLLSLPGASGELRKARGAWLRRAVELCGNKNRVYAARDVTNYFDDPHDHTTRVSGQTGAERAKAFGGTLAKLEQLVKDKKDYEAAKTKRERERKEAEAEKVVDRRESTAVQGAVARTAAKPSDENDKYGLAGVDQPATGIADAPARPKEAGVLGEPANEDVEQDVRTIAASDFIGMFADVQQAVAYLIESRWNKAAALAWVTAWASNDERAATKPPDSPWPPPIACGEVPSWEEAKAGQYVGMLSSQGRVMVVDAIRESEIVLEDPFYPRGKYPIPVTRDKWDQVFATAEERVKSEFARLNQKIPTAKPPKKSTDGKGQTARKKPAQARKPTGGKRAADPQVASASTTA